MAAAASQRDALRAAARRQILAPGNARGCGYRKYEHRAKDSKGLFRHFVAHFTEHTAVQGVARG
jgi:hypothetical protein